MICPKCQSEMPEGVKFCPSCGANLAEVAQQTAQEAVSEIKEEIPSPVVDTFNNATTIDTDSVPSAAFDPGAPIAVPKKKAEEAVSDAVDSVVSENTDMNAAPVVESAAAASAPAFNAFQPQVSEPVAPVEPASAPVVDQPAMAPAPAFQPQPAPSFQPQPAPAPAPASPVVPVVAPIPAPLTPNNVPSPVSSFKPEPTTKNEVVSDADRKPLSVGGAFWLLLLFAIPVVGFICSIIFSVSGKKKSRKNLSRAVLIWKIIGIILVLIFCILLYFLARDAFAAIMHGDINDFIDELSYFFAA